MKVVRYIVGVIGLLLVWFVIATIVGIGMAMLFPRPGQHVVMVGIGPDWRNLPGAVLGLFAGVQSFRASVRERQKKAEK